MRRPRFAKTPAPSFIDQQDAVPRRSQPDFIAVTGSDVNLVPEIKGREWSAEIQAAAARRRVEGFNREARFGMQAHHMVYHPDKVPEVLFYRYSEPLTP